MGRPLLEVPKSRIKGYLNRIKGVLTRKGKMNIWITLKLTVLFHPKTPLREWKANHRVVEIPNKGIASGIYKVLV